MYTNYLQNTEPPLNFSDFFQNYILRKLQIYRFLGQFLSTLSLHECTMSIVLIFLFFNFDHCKKMYLYLLNRVQFGKAVWFLYLCAPARIRTWDPISISDVLYQLSYKRILFYSLLLTLSSTTCSLPYQKNRLKTRVKRSEVYFNYLSFLIRHAIK